MQQAQPVIHTRGDEVIKLNGAIARWPRPPTTSPSSPLVYVVMRRQAGTSSSWRQISQVRALHPSVCLCILCDVTMLIATRPEMLYHYVASYMDIICSMSMHWRNVLLEVFSFPATFNCFVCVFVCEYGLVKIVQFLDCSTLLQTVDLTTRLPAAEGTNLGSATIRVLVVDPEGLVTIYSPVSHSESDSPAVTLGSDVRSKVISKVMAGHRKKINTEVTPTTTKSPSAVSRQCNKTPDLPHITYPCI
jgi:hypothetical protein